ncbi:MAG: hypothetical protein DKINENOH_04303 [bacterium]|nr:hypothetical protein [bacterium]
MNGESDFLKRPFSVDSVFPVFDFRDSAVNENMNDKPQFQFHQTGAASGVILDRGVQIAEIRDLQLCTVRFQNDGPLIIGEDVATPLFWWQYADHQNPERHCGYNGKLRLLQEEPERVTFVCEGTNASGSALSRYEIEVTYSAKHRSYVFRIAAQLTIPSGKHYLVTPNPSHGELEFCNFWPEGVFSNLAGKPKRYQACYVQNENGTLRIPHHHLETSDKHNIVMKKGTRFCWLLEDTNPVVEIISENEVCAGLCAYMWDAHFGYRICDDLQNKLLTANRTFSATFLLYAIDRQAATALTASAREVVTPEINQIPIYVPGVNTFAHTLLDFREQQAELWPWSHECEGAEHHAEFVLDRERGIDDSCSLRIRNTEPGNSQWVATTLGPAFGQPAFREGARLRLTAYVRTEDLQNQTGIAIRLHRPGQGDLFKVSGYEVFPSQQTLRGTSGWQRLQVTTPPLSPAPDRVHLLLRQSGAGTSWFDNVLFEPEVPD